MSGTDFRRRIATAAAAHTQALAHKDDAGTATTDNVPAAAPRAQQVTSQCPLTTSGRYGTHAWPCILAVGHLGGCRPEVEARHYDTPLDAWPTAALASELRLALHRSETDRRDWQAAIATTRARLQFLTGRLYGLIGGRRKTVLVADVRAALEEVQQIKAEPLGLPVEPLHVRLRQAREQAGLTQEQAGERFGCAASGIHQIEIGTIRLLPRRLEDLLAVYGVRVELVPVEDVTS